MKNTDAALKKILDKLIAHKYIFSAVLNVQSGDNAIEWAGASGVTNQTDTAGQILMRVNSPYHIASITKIFTAAAVMSLHEDRKLDLADPIAGHIPPALLEGIHTYKGKDYVGDITIAHLLAQTSGLGDYFMQKGRDGQNVLDKILADGDYKWDLKSALKIVKNNLKPRFPPARVPWRHNAFYSDTNFQLLGGILEYAMGKRLGEIYRELFFDPLDLRQTYLFGDDLGQGDGKREAPASIYYKDRALQIPDALKSFGPDGGIVSNTIDQIKFFKALLNGEVFKSDATLSLMKRWNNMFFPLDYGFGLMRYKLPRFFSPFKPIPEFYGHSGASGTFLFYCPEKDIYIAGAINQLHLERLPFQILPRIVGALD